MNEIEAEMIGEMGLGGGAGIGLSLPGGYINGAPDPTDVKKLKSKLDGDGSEEYQPIDEKVVDDIIICDNCNWQWEMKEGGDAMYLCHKCGHDNHPKLAEGLNDLEKELVSLYNKAFKMMPKSPAQMKVRAEIDKVKKQIDSLKKEAITEAEMNPVKKVVNAILKKHGVNAMKTTSTSVRGFHNIVNNGYSYDGNNFLRFYKVSPDVVKKVADEIQKAGVRVYGVNKSGTISGDFSKTGLNEAANENTINEGFGDSIKKIRNLAIKMASTKYDRAKSHLNLDKIASSDDFDGKDTMNKATAALLQQKDLDEDLKSAINKIAVKLGTGATMMSIITALVSMSGWIQYLDSSFTKWYYTEIQKLAEPEVMKVMQDLGRAGQAEGSIYGKIGMYAFFIFFTIAVISLVAARMTKGTKNEYVDKKGVEHVAAALPQTEEEPIKECKTC
jgi:hypothetical protein